MACAMSPLRRAVCVDVNGLRRLRAVEVFAAREARGITAWSQAAQSTPPHPSE
jgi:hypothetical protein